MKKASTLLITFVLLLACNQPKKGKNGVAYANAIAYNDYIINRQMNIVRIITKIADTAKVDFKKADQLLDSAIVVVDKEIMEVEGMPDWKGNTDFRDNAVALFRFYKTFLSNQYRKIIALQKDGEVSLEEEAAYNRMMSTSDSVEERLDNNFKKAQQVFGTQTNLIIERNTLQDTIDYKSR